MSCIRYVSIGPLPSIPAHKLDKLLTVASEVLDVADDLLIDAQDKDNSKEENRELQNLTSYLNETRMRVNSAALYIQKKIR